jgi:hypothetical protein
MAHLNTAYPWMRIPLNISTIGWNEPLWVGQIELRSFKQAQGSTPLFDFPIFPVFAPQRDCFSEMPLLGDRELSW